MGSCLHLSTAACVLHATLPFLVVSSLFPFDFISLDFISGGSYGHLFYLCSARINLDNPLILVPYLLQKKKKGSALLPARDASSGSEVSMSLSTTSALSTLALSS